METNELRIRIAESVGWKDISPCTRSLKPRPDGVELRGTLNDPTSSEREYTFLPNWPTDANAALQLVEVLAKDGWNFESVKHNQSSLYLCSFWRQAAEQERFYINAPTLPEAICLAYCAVRGIAEKGKEA